MTAKQLALWRAAMAISQVAAAKALGISIRQYIRYETGERKVPKYIDLACQALRSEQEKTHA